MAEQVTIEGKEYISSKRASELSGYAQDYIGQLARGGQIDAQRVGGLWFVLMQSLESYKEKAEAYKPEPPVRIPNVDPESLLTFDGKDYMSAARAAKVTGYHQDYVGQLARSGTILSRQVGNRWYVEREGITAHKREKDALLAAVQAESVGIVRNTMPRETSTATPEDSESGYMTYSHDEGDLMPAFGPSSDDQGVSIPVDITPAPTAQKIHHVVPSRRVLITDIHPLPQQTFYKKSAGGTPAKSISYAAIFAGALTVVIVLTIGITTFKTGSMYAAAGSTIGKNAMVTNIKNGVLSGAQKIGDVLEAAIVPELIYRRQ